MEILLIENIKSVGMRGDIVTVRDGYARNFLLPCGKALLVTPSNKRYIEYERERSRKLLAKEMDNALAYSAKLEAMEILTIAKKVGRNGILFGSVTSSDIVGLLKVRGFDVDKRDIVIPHIKSIGNYEVDIRIYTGIHAKMRIDVVPSIVEA